MRDQEPINDSRVHNILSTNSIYEWAQIEHQIYRPGTHEFSASYNSLSTVHSYMASPSDTTNTLAEASPSTSKKNKSFPCPDGLCKKIFTTKYRLKSAPLNLKYIGRNALTHKCISTHKPISYGKQVAAVVFLSTMLL